MAESATVGTLRVLLTANSAEFESGLAKASRTTKSFGQEVTSLGKQMAGAFGVTLGAGALIAFGKQLLDAADATVKLSDKTGIAIEPLQRLQFVAEQSGNSIEQVSNAVSMMQRRLAEGDRSAVGALKALGIEMTSFLQLTPDQQFMAIAREVGKIEDPMKRAHVATELFGRAGAELLPTLVSNVDELANKAPVMSERATRAFDTIGDAIGRVWTTSKNLIGEGIGGMIDGYTRLGQTIRAVVTGDLTRAALVLADQADVTLPKVKNILSDLVPSYDNVALSMADVDRVSRDLSRSSDEQTKKAQEFKTAQDQLFGRDLIARANDFATQLGTVGNVSKLTKEKKDELRQAVEKAMLAYDALGERAPQRLRDILAATTPLLQSTDRMAKAFEPLKAAVDDAGESLHVLASGTLVDLGEATNAADEAMEAWANKMGARYPAAIQAYGSAIAEAASETQTFGNVLKDNLLDVLGGIPQTLANAFTGGGNIGGAIKSLIGQVGSTIGSAVGSMFGPLGQQIGSAIGSLLGPLAGKIGGFFKGLFGIGVNDQVKKFNAQIDELRQKLLEQHGTLAQLEAKANAVGLSFTAAWGHQNQAGLAAFTELMKEFERRTADAEAEHAQLVDDIKAAQDELGTLTSQSEITFGNMSEAAQRYGVDLGSLGPKFQSGRLHEGAQQIWNDFILLTRGGADVGGVLLGMKDEIVDLARESVQFGVQIPANFKPLIDNLLQSTELTDDEREALQKLGAENFGDPVVAKLDVIATRMGELIDRIVEMTDRLTRNVPMAAQTAAAGITDAFSGISVDVPVNFNVSDMPNFNMPHMESGGIVTHPTIAMIGERGPEAVIPLSGAGSGGGILGGDLAGVRSDIQHLERTLLTVIPSLSETAARHGAMTAGRGR